MKYEVRAKETAKKELWNMKMLSQTTNDSHDSRQLINFDKSDDREKKAYTHKNQTK